MYSIAYIFNIFFHENLTISKYKSAWYFQDVLFDSILMKEAGTYMQATSDIDNYLARIIDALVEQSNAKFNAKSVSDRAYVSITRTT